jgi:hypothetical protein
LIRRLCAALALILTLQATPAHADWNHPLPYELYRQLSDCETGSNTAHLTRSYVGAFGFYKGTWRMFSSTPPTRAYRLTYGQQARVLDRAFWFGYGKQYAVGPWGHGCFKHYWLVSSKFRTAVCNNRKHQVRRWCR